MKNLRIWLTGLTLAAQGFSLVVFETSLPSWLRQWIGASFAAQALSVGLFTGGMAAGAWLASQKKFSKPATSMGLLLMGNGFILMTYSPTIRFLQSAFTTIPGLLLTLLTVFWALPAAMVGGAMYPVAVSSNAKRKTGGWFYAAGLIGAAMGIGSTIFWFYGHIHLGNVLFFCGLPLLATGLLMLFLKESPSKPELGIPATDSQRNFAIFAFFLGIVGMLFQLSALRLANLSQGASYRTFGAVFLWILLAAGIGSIWASRKKETNCNLHSISNKILIYSSLLFISLPLYRILFYLQSFAWQSLSRNETGYQIWAVFQVLLPLIWVAAPSLMNGYIFTRLAIVSGREAGKLYAAETLGTLIGATAGYLLLLPVAGPAAGIMVTGLILMIVAATMAGKLITKKKLLPSFSILSMIISLVLWPSQQELFSGVFRTGVPHHPGEIAAVHYGKHSTIAITFDSHGLMSLLIDGKPDAGISMTELPSTDEPVEILLGALPLSLKPEATRIATIGMGSGLTASILTQGINTKINDILEIEPAVIKAAENFGERVAPVYHDSRSQIHTADARGWFLRHKNLYDIIVSEPSNPWVMGNSSLFNSEFYKLIKAALNQNGIFVQWIQLYETREEILASILFQMGQVFEDYTLYLADDGNLLVVTGKNTNLPEPSEEIFRHPALARHLTRLGIYSPADLKIRNVGDKSMLDAWSAHAAGKLINHSDLLPAIEPLALRVLFMADDAYWIVDLKRLSATLLQKDKPGISAGFSPYGYRLSATTRAIKGRALYDLLKGMPPDTIHMNAPSMAREISQLAAGFHNPVLAQSPDFLALLNDFYVCLEEFAKKEEITGIVNPFGRESQAGQLTSFHLALIENDREKIRLEAGKILSRCNMWPQPVVEFAALVNRIMALDISHRCLESDVDSPAIQILMESYKSFSTKTSEP